MAYLPWWACHLVINVQRHHAAQQQTFSKEANEIEAKDNLRTSQGGPAILSSTSSTTTEALASATATFQPSGERATSCGWGR